MLRYSLLLLLFPSVIHAEWPEFRGPGGQGHSSATGLPLRWSETTNVRWKTAIPGRGWSSPVVGKDQVWLTTALDNGKSLRAVCVEAATGKIVRDVEVFRVAAPPEINKKNTHATPTPILEDGRLYVHYGTLGTACLDTASGKILWTNDELKLDHKEGPGSSPIVWGDLLILNCDGIDVQYIAALEKKTGRLAWKTKRTGVRSPNPDFRKAYSTPLLIRTGDTEQIVSVGADRTSGYDPATGKEIWWVDYNGFSNVPRPVYGHGLVFISTGYLRPQLWAVRPEGKGERTKENVVWRDAKNVPANSSPLLVDDILYAVTDQGIAVAREAKTGRVLWTERLGGPVCSSPLYADGRIYICEESGKTSVLKPGAKFELLATNELEGRVQASPAVADKAIFLRTESHLYRLEEKGK